MTSSQSNDDDGSNDPVSSFSDPKLIHHAARGPGGGGDDRVPGDAGLELEYECDFSGCTYVEWSVTAPKCPIHRRRMSQVKRSATLRQRLKISDTSA